LKPELNIGETVTSFHLRVSTPVEIKSLKMILRGSQETHIQFFKINGERPSQSK